MSSGSTTIAAVSQPAAAARTTRRMAREAGGLQAPKLEWSTRSKSPAKSIPSASSVKAEMETYDGLDANAQSDPRKDALRNSINGGQPSGRVFNESSSRSSGKYSGGRRSEAGREREKERSSDQRVSKEKMRERKSISHKEIEDEEKPLLESEAKEQETDSRAGTSARRVVVDRRKDRGATTTNKEETSRPIKERNSFLTNPDKRIRSSELNPPTSKSGTPSNPTPIASPTSARRISVLPSSSRETKPPSPSATRNTFHQTIDESTKKVARRVLSPEKRPTTTPSSSSNRASRPTSQFQISNASEDALKKIERKLQTAVSSSSKYQSRPEKSDTEEIGSYVKRKERGQSSPSKEREHLCQSDHFSSRINSFPSTSSFGDENDSVQSLAPTTPSPGLSPTTSPNAITPGSKISPVRRQDYFGKVNSVNSLSPSKPLDLHSLKPSPGKAKRGMFREDSDDDDEFDSTSPRKEVQPQKKSDLSEVSKEEERRERKLQARPSLSRNQPTKAASKPNSTTESSSTASPLQALSADIENALENMKEAASRRRSITSLDRKEGSGPIESSSSTSPTSIRPSKMLSPHRKWAEERNSQATSLNRPARSMMEDAQNPFVRNSRSGSGTGGSSFMEQLRKVNQKNKEQDSEERENRSSKLNPDSGGGISRREERERNSRLENELLVKKSEEKGKGPEPREIRQKEETEENIRVEEASERERKRNLKARRFSVPVRSSSSSDEFEDVVPSSDTVDHDLISTPAVPLQTKEEKKAVKAARRKSLYSYTPTKKDDWVNATQGVEPTSTELTAGPSTSIADIHPSRLLAHTSSQTPSKTSSTKSAAKTSTFLRGLIILVDVRDQDGSDASTCWIDMLKAAGSKVYVKPPSSTSKNNGKLTHIVYKAGKNSTRTYYRDLDKDVKPLVVGVGWIAKCMEMGRKVDEKEYIVELGKEAIFSKVSLTLDLSC